MTDIAWNTLIVEDDKAISEELTRILQQNGFTISGIAKSSSETFRCIEKINPDLILININIKGSLGGAKIGLKIQHLDIPILFIGKSKKKQNLSSITDVNHFFYLENPFDSASIRTAIDHLFVASGPSKIGILQNHSVNSMVYKKRGVLHRVYINDILYVKAADDYTITVTPNNDFVSSNRLFIMQEKLSKFGFFKSHRSFLVNPKKVDSINSSKNNLLIKNHQVPISRNNKSEIVSLVKEILSNNSEPTPNNLNSPQ